ncbi:MAG: hypothetical protein EPO28_12440 [Saprospiraceae bacterium]|nr:MAG: hypothetical protein EPO28_12440 [Saprospiraceae bacterium]
MNNRTTAIIIALLLLAVHVFGQKKSELPAPTFIVGVSHDNVFGFYPSVYGSFGVKENLSFTFYGTLWTNPSFGNIQTGTDSWLETGFGLGITPGDGKWYLNPTLAFTHGKLLSGGAQGVIGDGIAPSFTTLFNDEILELEAFGIWYKALRKEGFSTYDYALYWLLPGFHINENISAGLHYEGFVLTHSTNADPETQYQMVGGYLKFTPGQRFAFRLSFGKNFKKDLYPNEFYKLNLAIPLL